MVTQYGKPVTDDGGHYIVDIIAMGLELASPLTEQGDSTGDIRGRMA